MIPMLPSPEQAKVGLVSESYLLCYLLYLIHTYLYQYSGGTSLQLIRAYHYKHAIVKVATGVS